MQMQGGIYCDDFCSDNLNRLGRVQTVEDKLVSVVDWLGMNQSKHLVEHGSSSWAAWKVQHSSQLRFHALLLFPVVTADTTASSEPSMNANESHKQPQGYRGVNGDSG